MEAELRIFKVFEKVAFYSVAAIDDEKTLTERFFEAMEHNEEHQQDVNNLVQLIREIGQRGAKKNYFRDEMLCSALPPSARYQSEATRVEDLRLYLYWHSEMVVILFGGGIKTAPTAQECPNVGPHFRAAQSLTKQLKEQRISIAKGKISNLSSIYLEV